MFASPLKTIIFLGVMGTFFTGCATKTLMTKDNKTYTRTNKITLIEDQVVAFGKPAQPLPKKMMVFKGDANIDRLRII